MTINEFQSKCVQIVKTLDDKYGVKRDPYLSFTQLMEEIGELAKEINKPDLRGQKIDAANLSGEIADVYLQLSILADMFNIDFEKAIEEKIKNFKQRRYL